MTVSSSKYTPVFAMLGLHREVDEICALLRYYAAYSGNSLPKFRDKLSAPSSSIMKSKKKTAFLLGFPDPWRLHRQVVPKRWQGITNICCVIDQMGANMKSLFLYFLCGFVYKCLTHSYVIRKDLAVSTLKMLILDKEVYSNIIYIRWIYDNGTLRKGYVYTREQTWRTTS
jgi:hypothetical protein